MSTQDLRGRRSTLLQRYQPGAGSQDPIQHPKDPATIARSTSQRSLQNSSLLQKYYSKTTSQDLRTEPPTQPETAPSEPKRSSSQRSLDKSKLLQRYYKQHSQDSPEVPTPEPQRYSSQKSLENSKLLKRYNAVNNSQEFTGLAPRESTPVARFTRSGSLDYDKAARSSLLSKYTPRFGKSLDRNKITPVTSSYSNYSSQQSLDQQDSTQNITSSQAIGDYGGDHYDQYDAQNIRSRSSSVARGLNRKSLHRDLGPLEKENIPLDPVTPETLPVVAASVPIMGNIASALPMPMLSAVTPAPIFEISEPIQEPVIETTHPSVPTQPVIGSEIPKRKEPVKPPRKDLAPLTTVSIPIPNIKTTITVEPPTPLIPPKKEAPVVPKDPSPPPPPLFSSRDRMEHYGDVTIPSSSPPSQAPSKQQHKSPARNSASKKDALLLPISDFSSRRSMTDLRQHKEEQNNAFVMEIDEFSDRHELSTFTKRRNSVKSTLASAFEQIAVLSVPQASNVFEQTEENIESLPSDRKLKKRDHTYHPSFVPKQAKLEENERKKQEEKAKHELHKQEQERKKEEDKLKKEEEKLRKEHEKLKKEEEKHRKEDEKRTKAEEEKSRKEAERHAKDEEKRMKEMFAKEEEKRLREKERLLKEDEKLLKEEEKRLKEEEKRKRDEDKRKQKEEKKKAASQKKTSVDQSPTEQPEEETLEFGNHLEQYSISGPEQQRSIPVGRPRSGGTPRGSQGALNRHTLPAMSSPPLFGSQQNLDRSGGAQSKMLQRYAKRSGSQDFTHSTDIAEAQKFIKDVHMSQGSLDHQRAARSSLLQKYTPKPLSASAATGGQAAIPAQPPTPKSTSQVSLDKTRIEKSSLLQRYKPRSESADGRVTTTDEPFDYPDREQRMAAVVFTPKKLSDKPTFDYRDHEYEPIGEPVDDKPTEAKPTATKGSLVPPTDDQNRKLSSASLRVPTDEGDTISMEDLQKDIEDRYFNRTMEEQATTDVAEPVEGLAATQEKTSKVKAAMARAQEGGKKAMARAQESSRNAMVKAQEGSKSLHQKLRKQTDKFKTKMSHINIKKDKDVAPLATPEIVTTPEIERLDFTLAEPKPEQETGEIEPAPVAAKEAAQEAETEEGAPENGTTKKKFRGADFSKIKNIHMPKIQKPEFKRPEFTKISKPKMPKLKTPDMSKFKRPEMPKFLTEKPDFSKIKMPEKIGTIKIQRSKSMKEPTVSAAASAASPSDAETPSVIGADGTKKKLDYTDFSTYPRLLDKFKRQKSTPSNVSVRAATPPPLEFTKAGKTSRSKGTTVVSRWAEKSSEDAGSNRFFSGSELGEREGSVERRMRQRLETAELEAAELPVTAEQKQLEEYDKENREIHLLSAARHDEFMKRKPPMERQESDLASEEEKQFWASSLGQKIRQNIDMNSNDFDFLDEEDRLRTARETETMGLSAQDRARFLGETIGEHSEKDYDMRSTTPYSNKECQSSGSSGIRRRKGVIEEIDDDEFFLRQKGISKDNIQMGEYISSAIKEGLSTPKNALAEMGRYDSYFDDEADASERMSMEYRAEQGAGGRYYQPSLESDDISNKQSFTDEFRKQADFYKTFPPDRPMRKHKKSYNDEQYDEDDHQKVPYDSYQQEQEEEANMDFYRRDRKYGSEQPEIHIEQEEHFMDQESVGNGFFRNGTAVPPTPPRRRKKRFRDVTPSDLAPFGNGLTSKPIYNSFTIGPETHIFNAEIPLAQEESFTTPLPTPRRSRSRSQISKLNDDDRTSRGAESYIFGAEDNAPVKHNIDMSDSNGYAIVRKEPPPRPPAPIRRRKSTHSLEEHRQFSTLPNFHSVSPARPTRNYSTINPNRPPRGRSVISLNENQAQPSGISKEDITQYEEIEAVDNQAKLQLQSGEVVKKMKDRPLPPPPRPPRDTRKPRKFDQDDRHDFDGGAERITPFDMIEARVIQEVEIAIQTDPVSDDFDLDIEVSETMGEVDKSAKTLQQILKQEQQAEIDRARQLAEANNLMRDIQKFRDSSSSLSQHGSRPETPSAMSFERRVSAPSTSHMMASLSNENLTEQDLANIDDDKFIAELVKKYVSEEKVTDGLKKSQKPADEPKRNYSAEKIDSTRLHEMESMIVQENMLKQEMRVVQSEPSAPPRRRSLVASTQDIPTSIEIPSDMIEEIVERLRTNEQQHIAELEQLHQHQLDDVRREQEEQRKLQEQKLEEQQKILLEQQNQQLHETQQLKEQILQQQEQQTSLLLQQQQQQQQLLLAQQQQQLLLQQQEKERELQRERERELLREREIELEKARERERELHHARELELQRARELEQQRAREIEQQRLRELELQHTMQLEHQRLRELEMQRAQEVEMQRAREAELQRARDAEIQRIREVELQRAQETEMKLKDIERRLMESQASETQGDDAVSVEEKSETVAELLRTQDAELCKLKEIERRMRENQAREDEAASFEPKSETVGKEKKEATEPVTVASGENVAAESSPVRPPPPRISSHIPMASQFPYQEYLPYALPPQPFYPARNYSDEEGAYPQAPHRRRRHHRSRRESTSEEEFQREQRKQRHETRSPEPSIPALSSQLIRACGTSIRDTGDELMTILRASSKDENKRDLHIALIILIVIVAGLMALGMSGEKSVHHHHWDYFNPPGSSGNA
ncbi:uncharacterized protein LOC135700598 isoform X1 [Ochlerotatus camptorhynchus]|uniref:uncharacterized protein LOC135700598 isoform X1 n=1 Tax=Ochlerotatus camptorhynchus TaxID=644619 RepID=UPI0031D815FA